MKSHLTFLSLLLSLMLIAQAGFAADHIHLDEGDEIECLVHGGFASADVPVVSHDFSLIIIPVAYNSAYEVLLLANTIIHARPRAPPVS